MYNFDIFDIHQQMLECVDEEQLERTGFQFDSVSEVTIEFYKTRDILAYSCVEMPKKYSNSASTINIQNDDIFVFCGALWPDYIQLHKIKTDLPLIQNIYRR